MVFKNIKNIREDRDIKQKDIAKVLNVSQNVEEVDKERMTQKKDITAFNKRASQEVSRMWYLE